VAVQTGGLKQRGVACKDMCTESEVSTLMSGVTQEESAALLLLFVSAASERAGRTQQPNNYYRCHPRVTLEP